MQFRACRFFVLVEGVSVNIQRSGRLCVAQETSYRCHIRAVGDQQTGVAVPEGMHIQFLRQTVLLQK